METFSALLALCAGNSPVTGKFPAQRPVTRSFMFSFDLLLNKQLSKQSWGWWFETPPRSLWRLCNEGTMYKGCGSLYDGSYWEVLLMFLVVISPEDIVNTHIITTVCKYMGCIANCFWECEKVFVTTGRNISHYTTSCFQRCLLVRICIII